MNGFVNSASSITLMHIATRDGSGARAGDKRTNHYYVLCTLRLLFFCFRKQFLEFLETLSKFTEIMSFDVLTWASRGSACPIEKQTVAGSRFFPFRSVTSGLKKPLLATICLWSFKLDIILYHSVATK